MDYMQMGAGWELDALIHKRMGHRLEVRDGFNSPNYRDWYMVDDKGHKLYLCTTKPFESNIWEKVLTRPRQKDDPIQWSRDANALEYYPLPEGAWFEITRGWSGKIAARVVIPSGSRREEVYPSWIQENTLALAAAKAWLQFQDRLQTVPGEKWKAGDHLLVDMQRLSAWYAERRFHSDRKASERVTIIGESVNSNPDYPPGYVISWDDPMMFGLQGFCPSEFLGPREEK